jgi:hypothetical protein
VPAIVLPSLPLLLYAALFPDVPDKSQPFSKHKDAI